MSSSFQFPSLFIKTRHIQVLFSKSIVELTNYFLRFESTNSRIIVLLLQKYSYISEQLEYSLCFFVWPPKNKIELLSKHTKLILGLVPKKERVEIKAQLLALLNVIIGSVRRVSGKTELVRNFKWIECQLVRQMGINSICMARRNMTIDVLDMQGEYQLFQVGLVGSTGYGVSS